MQSQHNRPQPDAEPNNSERGRGRGRRQRKRNRKKPLASQHAGPPPPPQTNHERNENVAQITENSHQPDSVQVDGPPQRDDARGRGRGRGRRGGRGGRGRGRGTRQRKAGGNGESNISHQNGPRHVVDTEAYGQLDDDHGFNVISSALESGGRRKRRGGKNRGRARRGRGRGANNVVRRAIVDSDSPSCSSVDSDIAADYVRNLLDTQEEVEDDEENSEEAEADEAFSKEILDGCERLDVEEEEAGIEPEMTDITACSKSEAVTKEEVANLDQDALENLCAYGAPSKYSKEEMDLIWSGNLSNYNDVIFRGAKPIAKAGGMELKQSPFDKRGRPIKSLYGKRVAQGKGFDMLRRMGWKEGDGLGINSEGRTEPVSVDLQRSTRGLGSKGKGSKGKGKK